MNTSDVDLSETTTDSDADRADEVDTNRLELAARTELLEAENERLRAEYARTKHSQYRRTAAGLALVGTCAALAAVLLPDGREVLFALASVGLFGGVLTYYLTPGSFVAADVGERIYAAMAANEAAIAGELGLSNDCVYLPDDAAGVRLYVPQRMTDELPTLDNREGPILTDPEHRGLVLAPTGAPLLEEFERTLTDEFATTPTPLATQLADGLVEQFELAGGAEPDIDVASNRITVAIDDSAFGNLDRFDHPIVSFLAVGLVTGLERPIRLEVTPATERADWLVTCRWQESTEEVSDETALTEK
ncbi:MULTISPECIES: hypothetical protein [unclassified Natrinema]|uniref:hypothetical protein n=1 Tax=unclassified Natrinema TaxID=2622230 RepID=UPI00026D46C5|nr:MULTISPECIES: hypothetical protein [unclassified Natrinema]AFO59085.1 hypothetical protein NJ7G_3869 [Natrinema sp. J7-2]